MTRVKRREKYRASLKTCKKYRFPNFSVFCHNSGIVEAILIKFGTSTFEIDTHYLTKVTFV